MLATKPNIIAQLRKDILSMECCKKASHNAVTNAGPGIMQHAFPNHTFPVGAVHEFCSTSAEDSAVTGGFVSGILSSLMQKNGVCIWISPYRNIFPPALSSFGIAPDKVIFINLQKEKEILWATEESLKCEGLAAVVAETRELSFTASRRLQLAVEQSGVTGFILRHNPRSPGANACVTRWEITSLPGELSGNMPGVGFPRWNVNLLKVRNGTPGNWRIEFAEGQFRHVPEIRTIQKQLQKKTG